MIGPSAGCIAGVPLQAFIVSSAGQSIIGGVASTTVIMSSTGVPRGADPSVKVIKTDTGPAGLFTDASNPGTTDKSKSPPVLDTAEAHEGGVNGSLSSS